MRLIGANSRSNSKLDAKVVFLLIKALSPAERRHISLLFSRQSSQPRYLELFERMKKLKEFEPEKLMFGKVQSTKKLNQIARDLAKRIITSQLQLSEKQHERLNFIIKSIELGLWDLIPEVLDKEMRLYYEAEEFQQLLALMDMEANLFRLYGIRRSLQQMHRVPDKRKIRAMAAQIQQLNDDLEMMPFGVILKDEGTAAKLKEIQDRYHNWEALSRKATALQLDLWAKLGIARDKPEQVREALRNKINFLSKWKKLCVPAEMMIDLNLMVHFLAEVEAYEEAWTYAEKIPEVEVRNQMEQELALRTEGMARVGIVYKSWEPERTKATHAWVNEQAELFAEADHLRFRYQIALSYFASGNWTAAAKLLSDLDNLPKTKTKDLDWQILCLIVANQIEKGNLEMVEYYQERGQQIASESGILLPQACFKLFHKIAFLDPDQDLATEYRKMGAWFKPILNHYHEARHLREFDVFYWMEAHLKGMTMREYRTQFAARNNIHYGVFPGRYLLGHRLQPFAFPNWSLIPPKEFENEIT